MGATERFGGVSACHARPVSLLMMALFSIADRGEHLASSTMKMQGGSSEI